MRTSRFVAAFVVALLAGHGTATAKNTGLVFISNEKSSTITVLNADHEVVKTFETCARPRGMHFSEDRTEFFVGCADDSVIAIYDVATQELLRRIRQVEEPETFDLHTNGHHLYISNEEDATATVFDVNTGAFIAEFETGEEPEGVQVTSDGRLVFVASEAANLVHVIDTEAQEVIKDILVDTRPRRFALTPDETELWVSAELAGIVDIISLESLEIIDDIAFLPTGFRKEQVTPVDVLITKDGARAYVALGRANHVAVVDVKSRKILDYILVGKRAWGLALTHDEKKVLTSIPVGLVPYGILVDDH
jgi:PQQ-dependent catabolism-associated beta-propeller protein